MSANFPIKTNLIYLQYNNRNNCLGQLNQNEIFLDAYRESCNISCDQLIKKLSLSTMNYSFFFRTEASILCLLLFTACILMVMFGRFIRNRFLHKDQQESKGGVNSLLGALFGLWGFVLAFTFGNSATRFDSVRTIMVEESNTIRNAIFRAKTFPDSIQHSLKADLELYLLARIDYYNYAADP